MIDKNGFTACDNFFRGGLKIPGVVKIAVKRSRIGGQCDKKPQLIQEKLKIYREGKSGRLYLKTILEPGRWRVLAWAGR